MDSEPYCVYNWLGLSFEGPDRDDWWVHDFLLAMPNATYDIFPKFLKLPPELPLRVYDYVFGYQEITSTLDRDGQMRIHDIEDEGTVASGLASGTINIHDEAEPVLYGNTLYRFTMSDLHDPKVGPTDINHFLPRMKHVALCISIFEVYEHWYRCYGTAWMEEWCVAFFKLLVNTKMPHLISFSLEMQISHSNCGCPRSPEAIATDNYPDPLPMPPETFQGILNAWPTLRSNGRVNFEGIFGRSFSQYSPYYDHWFQPLYAGFWNDFGTAENERLFRMRHPDMVTYYESRLSEKKRIYYKRYKWP